MKNKFEIITFLFCRSNDETMDYEHRFKIFNQETLDKIETVFWYNADDSKIYKGSWYENKLIFVSIYDLSGKIYCAHYVNDGKFYRTSKYYNEDGLLEITCKNVNGNVTDITVYFPELEDEVDTYNL